MSNRKILLFFLLIFFSLKSYSAVFVVTSNADSGPGTLRDALTQAAANGITEKDYINFNMADPSEAGCTITLITQLPNVTSNLVIDGTTQPGPALGVSNAKIILQTKAPVVGATPFNALQLRNVNGFELYGLYIRDFNYTLSYQSSNSGFFDVTAAVCVETSQNIQIGAPGKGNVFANDGHALQTVILSAADNQPPAFGAENLKFYSNICGFEPDGITIRGAPDTFGTGFVNIASDKGEIDIGGDDVADRNIFGNAITDITQSTFFPQLSTSTINIKNNYFDYNINGQPTPLRTGFSGIFAILLAQGNSNGFNAPYTINIINNKMQYPDVVNIGHILGAINFQGNSILYEPATARTPATLPQLVCQSDAEIVIGGVQPGDANIIYGTQLSMYSKKSVLIQHNSIYCVNVVSPQGIYLPDPQIAGMLPKIAITNVSASAISGTATPLSNVELFEDDDCILCEPLTYFATVPTDANGNWSYTGPINKGIIASATLNGYTSLFTASATLSAYTVTQSSCGTPGSLTGFAFSNSGGYQVKNEQGQVISNTALTNLAPGKYTVTAENGTCSTDYPFTILDATPKIDDSKVKIIPPSCGGMGSITGLSIANTDVLAADPNAYKIMWLDAGNNAVGNTLDLTNVPVGSYTLQVIYIKDNCTTSYGPIVLKNSSGPNIDQSAVQVQPASCGNANGSITNISITNTAGTVKYIWWNSQQQTVGTSADLTGQPGGVYKLEVNDDSQCGPVYTTDITIPAINELTLDESKAVVNPATCGLNNGSITGIATVGAAGYLWTDANGKVYTTTTADLANVPAGTYTLTVSNSVCSKPGSPHTITAIQPLAIVPGSAQLTGDECSSHMGSIKGITMQYGVPPYTFTWTDVDGKTIAQTADLDNVGAGNYTLTITDGSSCGKASNTYTLQNQDQVVSPPVVNDIQLCSAGAAILQVKDPSAGYSYRLYDSGTSTTPLDEEASGIFKINANANSSFYVSQFLGDCESTRIQAKVSVGIAGIDIANTITPNGDGINDYWTIKNIENFPGTLIQIFNRNGQKVYESKGYSIPFDGTYNNQKLAAGVYYYIINLGNRCNLLSGSLTIIR